MALPNYLSSTLHRLHPSPSHNMATLEPWAAGDPPLNPEFNSATATNIKTLTAAKNTVEITPVKAAFELAIAILTLVRVSIPVLSHFLHPFIGETTRTRR